MAALQFHKAQTIHSWSGIGAGYKSKIQTVRQILTNNSFVHVKQNVENIDTLFIDEIGMMSEHLFESLEFICR